MSLPTKQSLAVMREELMSQLTSIGKLRRRVNALEKRVKAFEARPPQIVRVTQGECLL